MRTASVTDFRPVPPVFVEPARITDHGTVQAHVVAGTSWRRRHNLLSSLSRLVRSVVRHVSKMPMTMLTGRRRKPRESREEDSAGHQSLIRTVSAFGTKMTGAAGATWRRPRAYSAIKRRQYADTRSFVVHALNQRGLLCHDSQARNRQRGSSSATVPRAFQDIVLRPRDQ